MMFIISYEIECPPKLKRQIVFKLLASEPRTCANCLPTRIAGWSTCKVLLVDFHLGAGAGLPSYHHYQYQFWPWWYVQLGPSRGDSGALKALWFKQNFTGLEISHPALETVPRHDCFAWIISQKQRFVRALKTPLPRLKPGGSWGHCNDNLGMMYRSDLTCPIVSCFFHENDGRDSWILDIKAVTATWNELSCYLPAVFMAATPLWNTTAPRHIAIKWWHFNCWL